MIRREETGHKTNIVWNCHMMVGGEKNREKIDYYFGTKTNFLKKRITKRAK